VLGVLLPLACLGFGAGAGLAMLRQTRVHHHAWFIISRLASSKHNPHGFGYLTAGLLALAFCLIPMPSWLSKRSWGSPKLCRAGRLILWLGIIGTAMIGVERAWFPTHRMWMEKAHLLFATLGFGGIWFGLALLDDAGDPRSTWQCWWWPWRTSFVRLLSLLPLVVLTVMELLPVRLPSGLRARVFAAWPRGVRFMGTSTFWQWYLVLALFASLIATVCRASWKVEPNAKRKAGSLRLDGPQGTMPHRSDKSRASICEPGVDHSSSEQ